MSEAIAPAGVVVFVCLKEGCGRPLRNHRPGIHQQGTNIWHCDHCGARYTNETLELKEKEKMGALYLKEGEQACSVEGAKENLSGETSVPSVEVSGSSAAPVKSLNQQSLKEKIDANSRPKTNTPN